MVDKSNPIKSYTNGEILTAEDLNTSIQDVGAVQYLVPYNSTLSKDSAGVVFLGTTAFPFGGIVLKTGYKILESDGANTTEITLGGGGASSGLATIELKNHNEKQNIFYPISETNYINESYTNTEIGMCRLGKSYGTGDGSLILLHNDYRSVSKCNALADGTGNWSAVGANSTVTLGGTTSIESGAAIYATVSATTTENGMRFILGTNTVSLLDSKLRFAWHIDTLTNIPHVKAVITDNGGTASSAYWELTAQASGSSLVAGAWNYMEVNIQGTADGTAGSVSTGATKQVHIVTTPTSSQAFQMAVDDVCIVDKNELKLPAIWQIGDSSNTQLAFINSGSKGHYQLGTTILNNYAITSTELRKKFGTISNNQCSFPLGTGIIEYSGNLAKEIWCIREKWLSENLTNSTESWSNRFYSPEFEIIDVPSSSSMKLKTVSGTGDSLNFSIGEQFTAYTKEWNGLDYDSPRNSTLGSNFKIFTITGSTTVSGDEMTVNHVESNTGIDANGKFFVVNNVSEIYSKVETASQNNSLVKATPTTFIPFDDGVPYFEGISAHWKLDNEGGTTQIDSKGGYDLTAVGAPLRVKGKFDFAASGFVSNTAYYRNFHPQFENTAGASSKFTIEAWVKFVGVASLGIQTILLNTASSYQPAGDGLCFRLDAGGLLTCGISATYSSANVSTYQDNEWHYVVGIIDNTSASGTKKWVYVDGVSVGSVENTTNTIANADGYITIGASATANEEWAGSIDDVVYWHGRRMSETQIAKRYNNGRGRKYRYSFGYMTKGTVSALTGNKYTLARKLKRQNTANEDPVDLEFNGLLS